MKPIGLFTAILALTAITACNNGGSSTTTAPSVPLTTETFTGIVPVGGSDFHNFTVAQTGEVDVTLTAAGPPPTISMGLGVGTGGASCVLLPSATVSAKAGTTAQISGTSGPGTLCVEVFDLLNQVSDVTYTVTVAHP